MTTTANEIKKGQSIKNKKGHYSTDIYASRKRNLVTLADGSRYGYEFAISLQNKI